MNIIIETDLGRDPDDLWAILYLMATGIKIKAITISPGYKDQVAIADFLRNYLDLDFEIGSASLNNLDKMTVTPYHQNIIKKFGLQQYCLPDSSGEDMIENIVKSDPEIEFIITGPLSNVGSFFKKNPDFNCKRTTMQGGFIGYDVHNVPVRRLKRFEGRKTFATFNLGASGSYAHDFLKANIKQRNFVGKHLCHSIILDRYSHGLIMKEKPKNKAAELFQYSIDQYYQFHSQGKKFHDPVAAVSHIHPEITTSVKATLYQKNNRWGAYLDKEGDNIIVDIERKKFWQYISKSY